jgi:hypothetical protein
LTRCWRCSTGSRRLTGSSGRSADPRERQRPRSVSTRMLGTRSIQTDENPRPKRGASVVFGCVTAVFYASLALGGPRSSGPRTRAASRVSDTPRRKALGIRRGLSQRRRSPTRVTHETRFFKFVRSNELDLTVHIPHGRCHLLPSRACSLAVQMRGNRALSAFSILSTSLTRSRTTTRRSGGSV